MKQKPKDQNRDTQAFEETGRVPSPRGAPSTQCPERHFICPTQRRVPRGSL
jgi:hypothetical protein